MEVIYINNTYTKMVVAFMENVGVKRPTLYRSYKVREIVNKNGNSGYGLLLEGLVNPKCTTCDILTLKPVTFELSWNINRFTDLQGNVLTKKMMEEWQKDKDIRQLKKLYLLTDPQRI